MIILSLSLVGFEGYLEDPVAQSVSVERLNGHQSLIIVGHCNKIKTFAFVCLQVTDHLKKVKIISRIKVIKIMC